MAGTRANQLLLDTHRGDHDAAAALFREFSPRMLAYARAFVRGDTRGGAAEDAVQQAFVQVLTTTPEVLAAVEDTLGWLIRLTRNAALNTLRTHKRSTLREKMRAGLARRNGSHGAIGPRDELVNALSGLADEHRELLLLRHIAGLSFEQMAYSLGENRNTVAARYRTALGVLRAAMPEGSPERFGGRMVRHMEVHHE